MNKWIVYKCTNCKTKYKIRIGNVTVMGDKDGYIKIWNTFCPICKTESKATEDNYIRVINTETIEDKMRKTNFEIDPEIDIDIILKEI